MIMCHLVCVGLYCAARDSVRQSIGQANARDEYSKEQIDNSLVMCCCEVKGGVSSGEKDLLRLDLGF